MKITDEEFITNFHSLNGTTVGERRKNLFLLLRNVRQSSALGSGDAIEIPTIQPKTPLEEIFWLEVLIYFRKVPELVHILKSGNPILIEKILKVSSWFLEQALEHINEKELVEKLFPCISFNSKVKLINKLAVHLKNLQKADSIFEAIQNRYGLYLATKLLPCCSEDLIRRSIKSLRIEITPRQLLIIVKKYPHSTEFILEALNQVDNNNIGCKYRNVFVHLMKNDVNLFLKLSKEYRPSFRLGWRATDRFILSNKQDFIDNAQLFHKLMHKKQTTKSINQDFAEFYLKMFPLSVNQFKSNVNFYIELMSDLSLSTPKLNLLLMTFHKNYGSRLWDHSACITPQLLELMSAGERETWMQANPKPSDISEIQWTCLKKIDVSLPEIKKKLALTSSVKEQSELVGCLVETCRINGDRTALTAVCKYVLTQYRNDHSSSVLLCFLKTIKECFCLDTLDEEQWKYINDTSQLLMARNERPYYYFQWLCDYINYRVVNGLPVKMQLIGLVKRVRLGTWRISNTWHETMKKPQHQKQVLMMFSEIIPQLHKGDDLNEKYVTFLHDILTWNRRHPSEQISMFAYTDAINAAKIVLKKEDKYNHEATIILTHCLRMRLSESEKADWLTILLNRKNICVDMDIMEWLIKYEPLTVAKHTAPLVKALLDLEHILNQPFFWKYCRYYANLEIPQKIVAICTDTINSEEKNDTRKKNAVTALLCLLDSAEFIKFVIPYYPSDLHMEVNSDENQETYKLQQAITANLQHVIPSSSTLESVLHFCKGDYLKFIQKPLHSASLSVAEEQLVPFFAALADHAVSVRKHAIYHTFKVLDKAEIYRMLNNSMKTEKNASIRKVLFKATFRFFTKNPDNYLWNLVKENIKSVDVNDGEAFDVLMEISRIPPQYLAQYIVFTWEILEMLPKPDNKIEEGKYSLLDAVSPVVCSSLSKEFCWGIIQKYLFKSKELTYSQTKIFTFACKYVVYCTVELEQEKHLNEVFTLLKAFVNSTWYNSDSKSLGRQFVYKFVQEFCSFFLDKMSCPKSILIKFAHLWSNFLQPHEVFEEHLYLRFSLLYVDYVTHNLTLAQIGENLAKLCDSLLSTYGASASDIFCNSLNSFIFRFLTGSEELELNRLALIESIIKASNSPNCLLMAISLLPENIPTKSDVTLTYNRIIDTLELFTNSMVQLYLSCYLHNISECYNIAVPDKSEYVKKSKRRKSLGMFYFIEEFSSSYRGPTYLFGY